jgi:hypothetical protein
LAPAELKISTFSRKHKQYPGESNRTPQNVQDAIRDYMAYEEPGRCPVVWKTRSRCQHLNNINVEII